MPSRLLGSAIVLVLLAPFVTADVNHVCGGYAGKDPSDDNPRIGNSWCSVIIRYSNLHSFIENDSTVGIGWGPSFIGTVTVKVYVTDHIGTPSLGTCRVFAGQAQQCQKIQEGRFFCTTPACEESGVVFLGGVQTPLSTNTPINIDAYGGSWGVCYEGPSGITGTETFKIGNPPIDVVCPRSVFTANLATPIQDLLQSQDSLSVDAGFTIPAPSGIPQGSPEALELAAELEAYGRAGQFRSMLLQ